MLSVLTAQEAGEFHRELADSFYQTGHYNEAIHQYNSVLFFNPEDLQSKKGRAMSFFKAGDITSADSSLSRIFSLTDDPGAEMLYLKAAILHHRFEFDEAIKAYKNYLRAIPADHPMRPVVGAEIKRAASGLRIPGRRMDVLVENMGPNINTVGDEIRPLFSPNIPERIYFSSSRPGSTGGRLNAEGVPDSVFGHYSTDMYMAELIAGEWGQIEHINPKLNSQINEVAMDFSNRGRVLFYFRGFSLDVGRVFIDTFGIEREEGKKLARFDSPFVPELGDQGLSFVNDSTIVFSSARPGGFGGYDIYMAMYRNGSWSEAVNLGPEVNSEFDELDPFMTSGGRDLFFASNRLSSIGKLDIFHAHFDEDKIGWRWTENIGRPLNSAGNDRYFRISVDGNTSVFASDRPGGKGGYDLYLAYFRNEWEDQFEDLSELIVNNLFPLPKTPEFIQFDLEMALDILEADQLEEAEVEVADRADSEAETSEEVRDEQESAPQDKEDELEPEPKPAEKEDEVEPEPAAELVEQEVEWRVEPFYYDSEGVVLFEENIEKSARLAQLMKAEPGLKLKLAAFSAGSVPVHLDLFFSVNKAEAVANKLIDQGIEPQRITVVGYGSQYPVALNHVNREPFFAGQEANRRVEPILYKDGRETELAPLEGKVKPDGFLSSRYREFRELRQGVSFKVQIGAARNMLNMPAMNRYSHPMIERQMDSEFYRYTVGFDETFNGIKVFRDQVRAGGIDNAYIVPFVDGKRISEAQVRELSSTFEELKHLN